MFQTNKLCLSTIIVLLQFQGRDRGAYVSVDATLVVATTNDKDIERLKRYHTT